MHSFPDVIPQKEAHVWATMIPGRHPEFKVHKTEGLANSALGGRGWYTSWAKYKLEADGQWHKVLEYQPPKVCRCGKEYRANSSGPYRSIYNTDPASNEPRYKQEPICHDCYTQQKAEKDRIERERRERAQLAELQAKYN